MLWGAKKLVPAEYWCPYGNCQGICPKQTGKPKYLIGSSVKSNEKKIPYAIFQQLTDI